MTKKKGEGIELDGLVFHLRNSSELHVFFLTNKEVYMCFDLARAGCSGGGEHDKANILRIIEEGTWIPMFNIKEIGAEVSREVFGGSR